LPRLLALFAPTWPTARTTAVLRPSTSSSVGSKRGCRRTRSTTWMLAVQRAEVRTSCCRSSRSGRPRRRAIRRRGDPIGAIDLTPSLTPPGRATWVAIGELAALVPVEHWSVVGSPMVAIHAARFGVVPPRPTTDGDIVVDVRAFGRHAMRETADALLTLGFAVEMSPEGVTRFTSATAKVDLLAPEGVGTDVIADVAASESRGAAQASHDHLRFPAPTIPTPPATRCGNRHSCTSLTRPSFTRVVRTPCSTQWNGLPLSGCDTRISPGWG
jgi:hypothetical protein